LRPNVRKDGLEIVFDSNRTGGYGGQDIWTASRASVADPWSTPINVAVLNTAAGELRASFSWDGSTLYFGRNPSPNGSMDLWFTTRTR
jgi:WD40-like Beta Propeller Repeat.